jgi:branched-chain amino acid transport system permease protein
MIFSTTQPRQLLYLTLLGLGLLAPWLGVYTVYLMTLYCFAIFACAFNLLLGYGGMLSFGHAAFFGLSSYVTGWLITSQNIPTLPAVLGGVLASGLLGLVFGYIAIRRSGIYFAMITMALAQIVYFVCLQASFTGGENGLQGVPRGSLLGLDLSLDWVMYYLVLASLCIAFLFIERVIESPFGQVLKAIRENETRAESLGFEVNTYKLIVFVMSAALSGFAGALKCLVLSFATLSDVLQSTSGEVILMTMLGGVGTLLGPVVGAGVVVTLQNSLADKVGSWVNVIIGGIFVMCVLAFRKGVVGEILARFEHHNPRREPNHRP